MFMIETLTFSNESTSDMCVNIMLTSDGILEDDETFNLTLTFMTDPEPENITINPSYSQVTITDDDSKSYRSHACTGDILLSVMHTQWFLCLYLF